MGFSEKLGYGNPFALIRQSTDGNYRGDKLGVGEL
jgi:hypothetical protein